MSCTPGPRFAQFVRSNVRIKKNSNTDYTLTLCKLAPITLYQIISRLNPDLNKKRFIENINLGKYAELLQNDNNIDLTSIMYVNGKQYGFALKTKTTRIINCNKLRFEVTTSIIDNKTKNVSTNLPSGFFKNAVTLVNNISYSPDECPFPSDKNYFASFVSGNINIQKEGDYQYKITFKKSGIFTSYQIRNSNVKTREIVNFSPKDWVNNFSSDLGLTSLMRLNNGCIYGFVLTNAFFNNNVMTWLVTTNQIFNKSSTVANGFKTGDFNDVVFDIDPNGVPPVGSQYFSGNYLSIDPNQYISTATFNSTTGDLNFTPISPDYNYAFYPFPPGTLWTNPITTQICTIYCGGGPNCYITSQYYPIGMINDLNSYVFGFTPINLYTPFKLSSSNLPFRLIVILFQDYVGTAIGVFYCDVFPNNQVKLSQP